MPRVKLKLNPEIVRQIRSDWKVNPRQNPEKIGKKYGVSVSTIKAVVSHKTWRQV